MKLSSVFFSFFHPVLLSDCLHINSVLVCCCFFVCLFFSHSTYGILINQHDSFLIILFVLLFVSYINTNQHEILSPHNTSESAHVGPLAA